MPAARACNGCRRRFKPVGKEALCDGPECQALRRPAAAVTEQRKTAEPWRSLYKLPAWHAARERALARDDRRCRGSFNGARCRHRTKLQVHHRKPLRELWADALDYADFVALACNIEWLVTLCPRCHSLAEGRGSRSLDGSRSSG